MHKQTLFHVLTFTLKWYKKLIGRFINKAFFQTIIIIFATLFSQIFMLLSTMMPLKVIMIMGSGKIPRFFPTSWQSIDKDMLIIYLATASVAFFILYLVCEKIITVYSASGSNKILLNNKKIFLFQGQELFAQKSYIKVAKSLSNIIFFILALVGLGILYPLLSLIILIFIFSIYVMFSKMYSEGKSKKYLEENLNPLLDLLKGIGFFIIFAFILVSFVIDFYAPNILVAIIGVLLIRQMFSKLSVAIKDVASLNKNKLKVNSLFFFHHTKLELTYENKDPFWNMLENTIREEWIEKLLNEIFDDNITYINSQWFKINIKNIAFLKVSIKSKNEINVFLIKLYNKSLESQAIHEMTLLEEHDIDKFNLPLIGFSIVKGFHCNVYDFTDAQSISNKNFALSAISMKIKMMSINPSEDLVHRYTRSHPFLYEKLNKNILDKLYLIVEENELENLKYLEECFDIIVSKIQLLPLQIINPLVTKFSLVTVGSELSLLHWGGWKIDSIGVDYPIDMKNLDFLKENFLDLQNTNSFFKNIDVNDVILAALITQFYNQCLRENFTIALDLVPRILECISNDES